MEIHKQPLVNSINSSLTNYSTSHNICTIQQLLENPKNISNYLIDNFIDMNILEYNKEENIQLTSNALIPTHRTRSPNIYFLDKIIIQLFEQLKNNHNIDLFQQLRNLQAVYFDTLEESAYKHKLLFSQQYILNNCIMLRFPSSNIPNENEILSLKNKFFYNLEELKARKKPLCKKRELILKDSLNEIARIALAINTKYGRILALCRDEFLLTLAAKQYLLENVFVFHSRQSLKLKKNYYSYTKEIDILRAEESQQQNEIFLLNKQFIMLKNTIHMKRYYESNKINQKKEFLRELIKEKSKLLSEYIQK